MNEAVRDVDQLLDGGGEVAYVDRLIVPWCGVVQPTPEANTETGIPFSNADAVAAPAGRHDDRLVTASPLSSVASSRQPKAGAADAASAGSVMPLLRSKAAKSRKAK